MNVSGNTVVITGGTSGIGLALAERFLREKNIVIICGRRTDRLEKIRARHQDMITRICDVTDAAQREAFVVWLADHHPAANVLVNNAGIQLLADIGPGFDLAKVRTELETNLVAPLHLAALLAPHLAANAGATIINVSSGLAFAPIAAMPVYCASKATLHSLTLSMRHQLKSLGIKVFELIPPAVDTELGGDRRSDPAQSHGGMPVENFVTEAWAALAADVYEAPVGRAIDLRAKREALFEGMNR